MTHAAKLDGNFTMRRNVADGKITSFIYLAVQPVNAPFAPEDRHAPFLARFAISIYPSADFRPRRNRPRWTRGGLGFIMPVLYNLAAAGK
jgi:hypothetical protein